MIDGTRERELLLTSHENPERNECDAATPGELDQPFVVFRCHGAGNDDFRRRAHQGSMETMEGTKERKSSAMAHIHRRQFSTKAVLDVEARAEDSQKAYTKMHWNGLYGETAHEDYGWLPQNVLTDCQAKEGTP